MNFDMLQLEVNFQLSRSPSFKKILIATLSTAVLNNYHPFMVLGAEVLLITYADEVLAYGPNFCGCLGLEDTDSRLTPDMVTTFYHKRVKSIILCKYLCFLPLS